MKAQYVIYLIIVQTAAAVTLYYYCIADSSVYMAEDLNEPASACGGVRWAAAEILFFSNQVNGSSV